MTAANDQVAGEKPICGFLLSNDLICYGDQSEPGKYCSVHDCLSCVGCGNKAISFCRNFLEDGRCASPLCEGCEHKEIGPHGPAIAASEQVRQGFISVVELTLKDAQSRGLLVVPAESLRAVAGAVVDDLSSHVMIQVLSGMANPRK